MAYRALEMWFHAAPARPTGLRELRPGLCSDPQGCGIEDENELQDDSGENRLGEKEASIIHTLPPLDKLPLSLTAPKTNQGSLIIIQMQGCHKAYKLLSCHYKLIFFILANMSAECSKRSRPAGCPRLLFLDLGQQLLCRSILYRHYPRRDDGSGCQDEDWHRYGWCDCARRDYSPNLKAIAPRLSIYSTVRLIESVCDSEPEDA